MMKKKRHSLYPNFRVFLLRLLGRLHCAVLVAIGCAAIFTLFGQKDIAPELAAAFPRLAAITPMQAYLRGLLFAVPITLSFYAVRLCPKLWQFLLCAIALCGLSWLLMGHPFGAIATAFCCIFRARARLAEEVVESGLDKPNFLGFSAFAVAFLISAVMENPLLQRLSVFSAALYLLLCLCDRGLRRLDEYLRLNEAMYGLPKKRIQRIAGGALAVALILAAALLLPAAGRFSGEWTVDLTQRHSTSSVQTSQPEQEETVQPSAGASLAELFGDSKPLFQIPPIVSYLLYAVIVAGLALLILFSVYRLILSFRRSFTDSRDQVQYLTGEREDEDERSAASAIKRPRVLDRTPNAVIRRRYRKQVLRAAKEPPRPSLTPQEVEAEAGLSVPTLHALYEKARYGKEPCTNEDVQSLKRNT